MKEAIFLLNNPNAPRLCPELAAEIGVVESVLLLQIEFWIRTSTTKERDGKQWTFQSIRKIQSLFCCWGTTTVHRGIKNLAQRNLIFLGNYNKHKYDQTQWFALNPEGIRELKSIRWSEVSQIGTPQDLESGSEECSETEHAFYQNGTRILSKRNDDTIEYTETTTENTIPASADKLADAVAPSKLVVDDLKNQDLLPEDGIILLSGEGVGDPRVKNVPPPPTAVQPKAKSKSKVGGKRGKESGEKETPMQQAMVGVLGRVTHTDPKVQASRLGKVASALIQAGYAPEQIGAWYGPDGWWFKHDWRGKQGQAPSLHSIGETVLAASRNINSSNARSVAKAVAHADAPVLSAEDKEQLRVDEQVTFWERHFKICAENITQGVITTLLKKDPNVGARFKHLLKAESSNANSQEDTGSVND